MRIDWIRTISFCVLFGGQLFAQSTLRDTTSPGTASAFEFSAGYAYMSMSAPSSPRLTLRGVDATAVMQFTPRWGAMLDGTYARAGIVPGTGHTTQVLSALIGPQFYLVDHYKTNVFVHGLVGSALVDSAILTGSSSEISGYVARFSYALGAGAEFAIRGPFAVRLSADYQRTTFVNAAIAPSRLNNIRGTTSLVYRFGSR
jgi:opacity protein-like surface antigen